MTTPTVLRRTQLVPAAIATGLLVVAHAHGVSGADLSDPAPIVEWSTVPFQPVVQPYLRPVPRVVVYSNGDVIVTDYTVQESAPLVTPLLRGYLDPANVTALMARAEADGLLAPPPDYIDVSTEEFSHPPLTELVLRTDTDEFTHTVFGLRPAEETRDRLVIAEFVGVLESLNVEFERFEPTLLVVKAERMIDDGDADPWPPSGPNLVTGRCMEVSDPATVALLRSAKAGRLFESDGTTWRVAAHPLLPGRIPGC